MLVHNKTATATQRWYAAARLQVQVMALMDGLLLHTATAMATATATAMATATSYAVIAVVHALVVVNITIHAMCMHYTAAVYALYTAI
jgi:hypothetical protein